MNLATIISLVTISTALACSYKKDCNSPIYRTVRVEPKLEEITHLAAHGWYNRTRGGEILHVLTSQQSPIAGEISVRLGSTPPGIAGIYYPAMRTAIINPDFRWDADVVMHELGHAMGVPHVGDPGSIMHPNAIGWKHDVRVCDHLCCR